MYQFQLCPSPPGQPCGIRQFGKIIGKFPTIGQKVMVHIPTLGTKKTKSPPWGNINCKIEKN